MINELRERLRGTKRTLQFVVANELILQIVWIAVNARTQALGELAQRRIPRRTQPNIHFNPAVQQSVGDPERPCRYGSFNNPLGSSGIEELQPVERALSYGNERASGERLLCHAE